MQFVVALTGNTRLRLELADPGFDASVLCEFRKRLVQGSAEHLLLDALLALSKERGWLKAQERQRTDEGACVSEDPSHQPLDVCRRSDAVCPQQLGRCGRLPWLVEHSEAEWVERYGHRIEESRLP
jgi:transposase